MSLELAAGSFNTSVFDCVDELVIQYFGMIWKGSGGITGATSLAAVTIESELGDNQHGASGIDEGAVHLAFVIFKDPEGDDLFCQPFDLFLTVIFVDA